MASGSEKKAAAQVNKGIEAAKRGGELRTAVKQPAASATQLGKQSGNQTNQIRNAAQAKQSSKAAPGKKANQKAQTEITRSGRVDSKGGSGAANGKSYLPQNIGKTYKGHGEVIDNIPLDKPSGIYSGNSSDPYHYINRVTGRSISTTDIYNTIKEPTAVLSQWKGQRFLYVGDNAAVVLNNKGELVTVWSRSDFGTTLEQILKEAH